MPVVLMAVKGNSMEDLRRMVELGAVEIIQELLLRERLQHMWRSLLNAFIES